MLHSPVGIMQRRLVAMLDLKIQYVLRLVGINWKGAFILVSTGVRIAPETTIVDKLVEESYSVVMIVISRATTEKNVSLVRNRVQFSANIPSVASHVEPLALHVLRSAFGSASTTRDVSLFAGLHAAGSHAICAVRKSFLVDTDVLRFVASHALM